jgi:hypothetical protein
LAPLIADAIIENPTPGNDQPATAGGTLKEAVPGGNMVLSYVTTDSKGNTVVVNVTVSGRHLLSPGIVFHNILLVVSIRPLLSWSVREMGFSVFRRVG